MLEDFQTLFDDGLTYTIYRGVAPGAETELLAFGLSDPFFIDTTALGGITYYYVIYAQTPCGLSPVSNEASAMLSCCTRYTSDVGCETAYATDTGCDTAWTPGPDCGPTTWTKGEC